MIGFRVKCKNFWHDLAPGRRVSQVSVAGARIWSPLFSRYAIFPRNLREVLVFDVGRRTMRRRVPVVAAGTLLFAGAQEQERLKISRKIPADFP